MFQCNRAAHYFVEEIIDQGPVKLCDLPRRQHYLKRHPADLTRGKPTASGGPFGQIRRGKAVAR